MKIFMVVYRKNGLSQKGVMAKNENEAMTKFNIWRENQVNKTYFGEAIRAYELEIIR